MSGMLDWLIGPHSLSPWQRGETRAPGFYWTRTGPRTHRVEVVR